MDLAAQASEVWPSRCTAPGHRTMGRLFIALLLPFALASCATAAPCSAPLHIDTSPGGAPEVSVSWLETHGCGVRVIDVREPAELASEGGIPGAEHVPLARLPELAATWSPRDPVVLVCRSGRRSARGVHALEALGFDRAASLTGGMMAWRMAGLPLVDVAPAIADPEPAPALRPGSLEEVLRAATPRYVRAATLLLHGTESCVDGREEHAVIGTPGGDAGELLLALSTIERLTGTALGEGDLIRLLDTYVEAFGRIYLHSDDHAMEALERAAAGDPRLRSAAAGGIEALVRHPPAELREALLEHLESPAHVGCGHLRLVLEQPEAYDVRPGLARALGRVVYRLVWSHPELVDFVVLHGEHHEEAVVNVVLPGEVHAFTNVPTIPPTMGGHSFFLNHPQAAQFVRAQHARFLFAEVPLLARAGVTREAFEAALGERAARQLELTLAELATGLPVFELTFEGGRAKVRGPTAP